MAHSPLALQDADTTFCVGHCLQPLPQSSNPFWQL